MGALIQLVTAHDPPPLAAPMYLTRREQALQQLRDCAAYARSIGVHEADILSAASVDSGK